MPDLCPDHAAVIANLARLDPIDHRDTLNVAAELARQHCIWHHQREGVTPWRTEP